MKRLNRTMGVAAALVVLASAAIAQTPPSNPFAEGKRFTIRIGTTPGIGYDVYGRLLARHMSRHLPGQPTILTLNTPGAGGLSTANYMYNIAPRDGTEIATFTRGTPMDPLILGSASTARFDARKFNWIGSMDNDVAGFYVKNNSPVQSPEELLAGKAMTVGSTGAGSDAWLCAVLLNALAGTKLKVVQGYPGLTEAFLAMERDEVHGVPGFSISAGNAAFGDRLKSGEMKVILQFGLQKHRTLPNVPLVLDVAKNDVDRQVLELVFSRMTMGRPFVAPPDMPAERVAMLRKAFKDTMQDPEFIADAKQRNLDVSLVTGEEVQALIERVYSSPEEVIRRTQQIVATR